MATADISTSARPLGQERPPAAAARGPRSSAGGPGGKAAPIAMEIQSRYRRADRLRIGAPAPDFELVRLDSPGSAERVRLSSFRGERPVVLFFGSYT